MLSVSSLEIFSTILCFLLHVIFYFLVKIGLYYHLISFGPLFCGVTELL
jgi:hypothetical protein